MTSIDASNAFLTEFKAQREDISRGLTETADLGPIAQQLARLRKELVDATVFLPTYDQRQCELQLTALEQQAAQLKGNRAPKSRFAFKRASAPPKSNTMPPTVSAPAPTASSDLPTPASTQLSVTSRSQQIIGYESLDPSQIHPRPSHSALSLHHLDSCIVNLLDLSSPAVFTITALHVRNLRRTIILAPFISGSALLHDCEDCLIVLGCHQFRMHTSKSVVAGLYVSSLPVIEHCTNIAFGPYPTSLSPPTEIESKHYSIQDFDWIKSGPSPNWIKVDASLNQLKEAETEWLDEVRSHKPTASMEDAERRWRDCILDNVLTPLLRTSTE